MCSVLNEIQEKGRSEGHTEGWSDAKNYYLETAINYNRRGNPAACSGEERRPPFSHKSSCMIYNCYLFR